MLRKDDFTSSPLQSFKIIGQVFRKGVMEHFTCVFSNRADACNIKQKKVLGWYLCTFQLSQKVETS